MLENAHLSEGVAVAKQRVTIADVAREAGTSTASVSYYLNDKREKLSEKTQAKIARVIKELGYVPNAQAQTLTGKQTHVIAIIILDNTNKWAGLVLNGMEQVMLPAGYQTVVCTSNFDPETELMYVDKMLSLGVDGFIIQPTANFKAVPTALDAPASRSSFSMRPSIAQVPAGSKPTFTTVCTTPRRRFSMPATRTFSPLPPT